MMDVLILNDAVVVFSAKKSVKYKRFLCEGPMAFVVKVYV